MQRSDLSAEKISAWREKLPSDIKDLIPLDLGSASTDSLDALADDLASASMRRIPEVLLKHAGTLADAGRARRTRVLAYAIPRVWGHAAALTKMLTDEDSSSGDVGRSKLAPLFRADLEAMSDAAMERLVRAMSHRRTVDSVAGGIREFDMSYNIQHGGSF